MPTVYHHRAWWALALFALAAAFIVGWLGRSTRLFDYAHPVLSTRGVITNAFIESGYDFRRRYTVSWFLTSNQSIASFHRSPDGAVQLLQLNPGLPQSLEQPAPLGDIEGQPLIYWAPSPDGQWLLTVRRLDRLRLYQVYRSDHTLHAHWTNLFEGRSLPDWLNNSQGFVEWPVRESRLLARVHWLDTAQSTEVDLETLPTHTLRTPEPLPQPCVPMLYFPNSPNITAAFLILSADRQPRNWKRVSVILPESLRHHEKTTVTLSPTADRLAWLCESTDQLPRPVLNRVPPFFQLEPQLRTSLFVSRPDGSQLAFLGRSRPGTLVPALRWSPKGDAFTFVYQNALWRQPLSTPDPTDTSLVPDPSAPE